MRQITKAGKILTVIYNISYILHVSKSIALGALYFCFFRLSVSSLLIKYLYIFLKPFFPLSALMLVSSSLFVSLSVCCFSSFIVAVVVCVCFTLYLFCCLVQYCKSASNQKEDLRSTD